MYNQSHYITMIKSIIYLFEKRNYKTEEIVKSISNLDMVLRRKIYDYAISTGKKKLASEIKQANKVIDTIQLEEFQASVKNGTHQKFLSNMSSDSKKMFRDYILRNVNNSISQQLTSQKQKYLEIIENAIMQDELLEAKSEGFNNLSEWKKFKKRNSLWNQTTKKTSKNISSRNSNPLYRNDIKSYINHMIEDLSRNSNNFGKWRLQYIKFKTLLSTKMISLTDIKRFAVALAYAKVIYTNEEQEIEFRKEQSNLLSLISLINNPTEIQSRKISYMNIDKVYQNIIESNFTEQRKR